MAEIDTEAIEEFVRERLTDIDVSQLIAASIEDLDEDDMEERFGVKDVHEDDFWEEYYKVYNRVVEEI